MTELLFYILGFYYLAFAVFHAFFWTIFNWRKDIKRLTFANAAILQILNIQLIVYFLGMASLFFYFGTDLLDSTLGFFILWMGLGFWLVRLLNQFVFLRVSRLIVHSLSFIFLFGIVLHLVILLYL